MTPDIMERLKASAWHRSALSSALTIYPCQIRVHQTLTVLNFLQLGRRSGDRPQRTVYSGGYLSTAVHTTLAGIEATTNTCTFEFWKVQLWQLACLPLPHRNPPMPTDNSVHIDRHHDSIV